MEIAASIISEAIGTTLSDEKLSFRSLALSSQSRPGSLSFLDDVRYAAELKTNDSIIAVFCDASLKNTVELSNKMPVVVDDPRWAFYSLHNFLAEKTDFYGQKFPTRVAPSAVISPFAMIDDFGVEIAEKVVVHAGASIYSGTSIGAESIIGPSSSVGVQGFEYKRTKRGVLRVAHDGGVKLGRQVEVGAGAAIAKGFLGRDTVVGDQVKIDNLVHIAHNCVVGEGSFIIATAMIGGSVIVGKNVWVGPGAKIRNGLRLGDSSFIGIGACVVKHVEAGDTVAGNPARIFAGKS
ncbi:N/A [soil metagenome]